MKFTRPGDIESCKERDIESLINSINKVIVQDLLEKIDYQF